MKSIGKLFFLFLLSFLFILSSCKKSSKIIGLKVLYESTLDKSLVTDVTEIALKHLEITDKGNAILNFSDFNEFNELFPDPAPGSPKVVKISFHYVPQIKDVFYTSSEYDFSKYKVIILQPTK